ncbi:MAG: hypothetical protein ACYDBQ_08895 [Thermoplasmatota archaeon]
MVWYRCPKCSKLFEGGPFWTQTCPACGHSGPARTGGDVQVQLPEGVVGAPRRFLPILGLGLLTLGIYLFVYYYKAYREADQQHGREHGAEMFWIGLIPVVGLFFQIAYLVTELGNVRGYRRAHGLRPGYGPAAWFTWFVLVFAATFAAGFVVIYNIQLQTVPALLVAYAAVLWPAVLVGVLVATYGANRALRQMWQVVYQEKREALPEWMRDAATVPA